MAKEIFVAYGIDVDAGGRLAGLLWRAGFALRHNPGMFAGEVGSIRLLRLFETWGIKTT
jgi:peptidoglycan-N-acetylglucosamine deacetylase